MKRFDGFFKYALVLSVFLHALIAMALFWQSDRDLPIRAQFKLPTHALNATEDPVTIQATVLDESEILKHIQLIENKKKQTAQRARLDQQHLDQKKVQAETKLEAALKKIADLKQAADIFRKEQSDQKKKTQTDLAKLRKEVHNAQEDASILAATKQRTEKKIAELKTELKKEAATLAKKKKTDLIVLKKNSASQEALASSLNPDLKAVTLSQYQSQILAAIGRHWFVPRDVDKRLTCKLRIELARGGSVLTVRVIQTSGDPVLDQSAQKAVYRASPLPIPDSADLFYKFKVFYLTVRPENVITR